MSAPTPKEIREAFQDYRSAWETVRKEAQADMQAISVEGPWTAEDRDARKQAGRPCIHLDQINQFINQTIGNVRKSKRSVKALPKGEGANDKDAQRRSSLIMGIEERSQAQPIYLNAFESMIQRSYGFALLRTEYEEGENFNQYICIKPVMNPDTVLISPHYKQPDASDIPDGFILDRVLKEQFKKEYPKAEVTDFSSEHMGEVGVSDWVTDKYVQKAEYWKIDHTYKTILLVEAPEGQIVLSKDDWEKAGKVGRVIRDRKIAVPKVVQYMTNGLEILEEIPWAGSRIPIIACFGPERWTMEGGNAKRQLLSMVRFARDPQMLFDYLATQECEEAGLVPKVPFVGYKGQFETDKDVWEQIQKFPHAFVQADVVIDGASGAVLPLPQRPQYEPNFQQYELAKDSAQRSVQASMGIAPLPTAAQRKNEKSGVALERIDDMESLGSFHFVDRYENCFLHNMGWQINELITPILDTQRQMPITEPDGKRSVIDVVGNTSHPIEQGQYDAAGLSEDHIHTGKGDFDVTISTGPSYASEREEQNDFLDQLISNIANLPQPGTPQGKVLALGIRMRPTLGAIGAQIADVFDPPSDMPPQAQAAISQLQSQIQLLSQENTALHMDRAGRVLENQTKLQIEQMRGDIAKFSKNIDYITQIVKAELAAKSKADDRQAQLDAQKELDDLGFHHEQIDRAHNAAHELGMSVMEHGQAKELADQQNQQALVQQQQAQQNPQV